MFLPSFLKLTMYKARIYKTDSGRYFYRLFFINGDQEKQLCKSTSDKGNYTQKHNAIEIIESAFPNFKIEDLTNEV